SIVVTAKPRARRDAGSTFAVAALSGPMFTKTSTSVTNIAGQKTSGSGASTASIVNTIDATSDQPDTMKSAPGRRCAIRLGSHPPTSVPAKPATTSSSPNVDDALA